ncbi:MAG: PspA/IM30 family protein [Planctomycetota bacterium]
MGFFSRLSDIVSANINDLLDRMENPQKMMKQLIREMEEAVEDAKGAAIKALADERRIEREIAGQKKKIEEWQTKAEEAVKADRDDLARRALELKKDSEDILAALLPEVEAAKETSAAMKRQLKALQAKLQEAKRKQATLGVRRKAAEMQKRAAGAGARRGKTDTSSFAKFEKVEEGVAQVEAEAEAIAEVSGKGKSLDEEFAELGATNEIDEELADLKKKLKKG